MRYVVCLIFVLLSNMTSASEVQQRYQDCMLEHLEKARTYRAVVVLSEICQSRSQLKGGATEPESDAKKAQYCALLGFEYIAETGRCGDNPVR